MTAREPADHGHRQHQHEQPRGDLVHATNAGAEQRAEKNRDERAHLDHGVAADEFGLVQVLRQDRELERAEESRLQSEQEQHDQHQRQVVEIQRYAGEKGDADLADLDELDESRLLVLVGQFSGGRREEEEWQDKERRGGVDREVRAVFGDEATVDEQDHQRRLEQVVVERAQELGDEQRQQPP